MIDVRWYAHDDLPLTIRCELKRFDLSESELLVKAFYQHEKLIEYLIYDTDGNYRGEGFISPTTIDSDEVQRNPQLYEYNPADVPSLLKETFNTHPNAELHLLMTEEQHLIYDNVYRESKLQYSEVYHYDNHKRVTRKFRIDPEGYVNVEDMWAYGSGCNTNTVHIPPPILRSGYDELLYAEMYPDIQAEYLSSLARSYDLSGAPKWEIRNFFDKQGRLIKRWHYRNGPKGMKYTDGYTIKYPSDVLIVERFFDADGKETLTSTLNIDSASRPLLRLKQFSSGKHMRITWHFDDDYRTCEKRIYRNETRTLTETTKFDSVSRLIEIICHIPGDDKQIEDRFEYDAESRLKLHRQIQAIYRNE